MAESTVVKVKKDGTLTITDATATPLSYTVAYENGDVQISQPKWSSTTIRDRGAIVGQRRADQQEGTISFSVHMREFTNGSSATLIDVIEKAGAWSAAVSVGASAYEDFMVDVALAVEGTDFSDSADHTITLNTCRLEWSFSEGDPNVINVTGTFYEGVTRTGPA